MLLVPDALRALRKALGEISQQALAVKLNMAVSSISHYESGDRRPDGPSALLLYRVAQEADREDLAEVFLTLINDAMGHMVAPIRNAEEHRAIRGLQLILFDPRFHRHQKALLRVLGPALEHLKKEEKRKAKESSQLLDALDAISKKKGGKN